MAVGRCERGVSVGLLASIPTFRSGRVVRYEYFTDFDRRVMKYETKL